MEGQQPRPIGQFDNTGLAGMRPVCHRIDAEWLGRCEGVAVVVGAVQIQAVPDHAPEVSARTLGQHPFLILDLGSPLVCPAGEETHVVDDDLT